MSTIKGMAQTGSMNTNLSGENTATNITTDFFSNVLATVNPNVGPIQDYLLSTMSKIQQQSQSQKSETAGIIIAMISVVTGLDIVMTTFVHVVTTQQTEFNQLKCSSQSKVKYNFNIVKVTYVYVKS